MDPLSLVAAGAPIVNGLMSFIGGSKANEQNIKLQRETNALNYQMWQENQAFQNKMFDRQLAAQDPAYLRRKLEDAGYNPAALVAGGQSMLGSAPSVSSTPTPAMNSPHVIDPVTPAVQVATQGMTAMADALNKTEEAKGKAIDNTFKAAHWDRILDNLAKEGLLKEEEKESYRWQNMITQHNFDALSKMAQKQLYELDAKARLADAQSALQDWLRLNKGPKEIEEISARINNLAAQGEYFKAQAYATREQVPATLTLLLMQAFKTWQEGRSTGLDVDMKEPVKNWIQDNLKGDDIKSDAMKLIYLWFTGGRPIQ